MKSAGIIALTVMGTQAVPSTQCLSCKMKDTVGSFLYTYSYCKETNECLMDEWNFNNQWCKSKWIPGWQLDIDNDCEANNVIGACETFVTTAEFTTNGG